MQHTNTRTYEDKDTMYEVYTCRTDMSDSDGSDKVDGPLWLQRLESFENLILVRGQRHVYLSTGHSNTE